MTPRSGRHARRRIPGQRQAADPGPELPPHDPELDSYLAALAAEAGPGAAETTGRFGSAQVFALRLPALRMEQLRRLAAARAPPPPPSPSTGCSSGSTRRTPRPD